ncbi:hypothetical protein [Pelagibacterium sp.]|uniref:hypothetical protein n=1 Tax=Pelagibacterium sp. TaxID=1967288 RepID=UPI003A8D8D0C
MRGLISFLSGLVFNVREDFREFASRHFSNGLGGSTSGIFIRLPFTRVSAFIEWREVSIGIGHGRTGQRDWSFYLGRVQGVLSIEPKVGTTLGRS